MIYHRLLEVFVQEVVEEVVEILVMFEMTLEEMSGQWRR
jgi:hypothetical protein